MKKLTKILTLLNVKNHVKKTDSIVIEKKLLVHHRRDLDSLGEYIKL